MAVVMEYPNKVFLVEFNGHYLGGEMIVVTSTKRKAFNRAKKKIEKLGLADKNKNFSMADVRDFDLNVESVEVIDNGDY
jgi:hypothetical protein